MANDEMTYYCFTIPTQTRFFFARLNAQSNVISSGVVDATDFSREVRRSSLKTLRYAIRLPSGRRLCARPTGERTLARALSPFLSFYLPFVDLIN